MLKIFIKIALSLSVFKESRSFARIDRCDVTASIVPLENDFCQQI